MYGECDNCRCYADSRSLYPRRYQFCAKPDGGVLVPCKPECCGGGCPGQVANVEENDPYMIVDPKFSPYRKEWPWLKLLLIFLIVISSLVLFPLDLKISTED